MMSADNDKISIEEIHKERKIGIIYLWQQIGNRKSASPNNICNRDKITAEKR